MTGRICKVCKEYKDREYFTEFKKGKNGLYPVCRECRKPASKKNYLKQTQEYKLWYRAKRRAKVKNMPFTLTREDITVPEKCPVFGVPMVGEYVPSLDRIDSSKGYTKDNIQVISNRANVLKNNATAEELFAVARFIAIGNVDG